MMRPSRLIRAVPMLAASASSVAGPGLTIVVLLVVVGCQFDPYVSSYSRTRPAPEEIIGTWVATPATRENLAGSHGDRHPRIELFGDGRIRILDVPSVDDREKPLDQVTDVEARWQLFQDGKGWWGIHLDRPTWFCVGCLVVLKDRPPHLLVIRYGDPDSGRGFEFERLAEQAPTNREKTSATARKAKPMVGPVSVGPQAGRVGFQAILDASDGGVSLVVCDAILDKPLSIVVTDPKPFAVVMAMLVTQLEAPATVNGSDWTIFCPTADGPGLQFRKSQPPTRVVVPKPPSGPK
jgi:hypothetical protein